MIEKLVAIESRFQELTHLLGKEEVFTNMKQYAALSKEHKDLSRIVHTYHAYQRVDGELSEAQSMLHTEKDDAFRTMVQEELAHLMQQKEKLTTELNTMLRPKDPDDDKNIILEIRAGTGGDEAALFVGDLFRMYKRFAEKLGWKLDLLDHTEGTAGGYKELICSLTGHEVYGTLKYESGVHRVQRVPTTETQGRVHTSAVSVVVLPEVSEVEVDLVMSEVRKDTFCASGPGGQSVNTTYSAVRLTHIPTGIVVSCQDGKSQLRNYDRALTVLRARLYERALKQRQESMSAKRKSMVRSGDRSEKIRTYNYPQGRITDHRVGYTAHNLSHIMDGDIRGLIEALRLADVN